MKSFQAKIGQRKPRKRENKNSLSVPFRSYSMHNGKFQRNSKKIKNIKKKSLWHDFKPKQVGKFCQREKIKILVPFRSYPKRNRKYHKNIKKFKKYHYGFI